MTRTRSRVAARPALRAAARARAARRAALSAQVAQEGVAGREWVGVAFRMAGELFLVAREETREVLSVPGALTRVPGAKQLDQGPRQRARPAAADRGPAAVPGQRRDADDPQHAIIVVESPRNPGGAGGRRSARLPPFRGRRIFRGRAADGGALRALSRRRVSTRRRTVARA